MLPEVVRPGQHAAVLHPDDLLVHEGAGLLPAGLEHRLAARGVPAVPGGVLGDRLGDGGGDEAVVELGALASCRPRSRRRRRTSPCSASGGSSRRSRRGTADRSRTAPPARRSSAGARPPRWCCRRRAAGGRRGSRDRRCARPGCAAARARRPAARRPLGASPPPTSNASSWSSSASEKPMSDRSKSSARQLLQLGRRAAPRPRRRARSACCRPYGRPAAAPRSGGRARSPAPRSARAASAARMRPWPGDHLAVVRHQHRHGPAELAPWRRRSSRPGRPRASWRSAHRASAARAAIARCAPERSSGSWSDILSGGGVDSGGWNSALDSTGPRWTPSGSRRKPPPEGEQGFVLLADIRRAGGFRMPGGFPKIRGCR